MRAGYVQEDQQRKGIHQGLSSEDGYIGVTSKQLGGEGLMAENMGKAYRAFHCQGEWRNEAEAHRENCFCFVLLQLGPTFSGLCAIQE